MKNLNSEEMQILSEPLLTSDGYLNPACMNELQATVAGMPKIFCRLKDDPEWATPKWIFAHDIVGAFAQWACRQSPYGVPTGLENVCKYLHAALLHEFKWNTGGMEQLSLCQINKALYDILYDQGIVEFDDWNKCKCGATPDIQFTSAMDHKRNPDEDFIDLDALLHNVCITIRDERRKDDAFDKKFELENQTPAPDEIHERK